METYYTLQKLSCAHLLLILPEKVFHHPYYFHSRQRTHTHTHTHTHTICFCFSSPANIFLSPKSTREELQLAAVVKMSYICTRMYRLLVVVFTLIAVSIFHLFEVKGTCIMCKLASQVVKA